ncbi:hypothetical protein F4V57_02115 [Acinetobacter qingfengensis]|uniref:Lipoprotein n=1 Tax=Acinetobacter qingfengensis TaxID=1262585 RepID=A0A1E7RF44_9GAMM|nr:hypothetical protein [Acinetobacter qingfengensis]KAA8735609.1 hypothetical protein F4V57_02115 [Acinetobacter qingfengensis]OEY97941.1 hypothetical protein BJI46_07700 [Acinetobacter qingfengensis]
MTTSFVIKLKITIAIILSAITLTACVSQQTSTLAIQKENNQFQVTGIGKDQLTAQNNAVKAAQQTCKRSMTPVVINTATKYNGTLSEETGKLINQAGTIAGAVIGRDINVSKDTDYNVTMDFYCKS